ncbi:MAG: PIN domain-containing protein [Opitutales bacterium]|nr:PIN domain-containing protein [Opitutales bacterium]
MILVDTSVWIEFFEGRSHWTKDRLKEKINDRETIAFINLILLEILQGIRERQDREILEARFDNFVELPVKRSTILLAAEIYQQLQRKGIRIRSIVDCVIGAVSIETGAVILHKDRDFDYIAQHYPIVTAKP